MSKKTPMPSLLPFLSANIKSTASETAEPVRLVINPLDPERIGEETDRFRFPVVSESDPLSRVIEAGLYTDAGTLVKRLYLIIQKDQYAFCPDDLWPVGNRDIDRCWQRAFEWARGDRKSGENTALIFKDQLDDKNRPRSYLPLFFCTSGKRFFHPPCPSCGRFLQLCTDDKLLEKFELRPYTSTLTRYLYCPSCVSEKKDPDFYVRSREDSHSPRAKDFYSLLAGLSDAIREGKTFRFSPDANQPPPKSLQEGKEALKKIVPFSFYPFYMLAFESASLNCQEFLALLSGASPEQLLKKLKNSGHMGRWRILRDFSERRPVKKPLLFHNDGRLFPEVLYLKLAFLGQLARCIFPRLHIFKYPDLSLSPDRIWVKLDQKGEGLPLFWDFRVMLMDIGGKAPEMAFLPKLPPYFGLHFLGTIWLFTLLANQTQGVRDIYAKISRDLESMDEKAGLDFKAAHEQGVEEVFSPMNIFWAPNQANTGGNVSDDPLSGPMAERYGQLWFEALEMGQELLEAGISGLTDWSHETFFNRLDELTEQVRAVLLMDGAQQKAGLRPPDSETDAKIHSILKNIAKKWQAEQETEPEDEQEEEDVSETIILGAGRIGQEGFSEKRQKRITPEKEAADLDETVVVSDSGRDDEKEWPPLASGTGEEKDADDAPDLDETVVVPASGQDEREDELNLASDSGEEKDADDIADLDETVVVPASGREEQEDELNLASDSGEEKDADDAPDLDETVVVPASGRDEQEDEPIVEPEHEKEEGADLDETIVVLGSGQDDRDNGTIPEREPEQQEQEEEDEDEDMISTVLLKPGQLAKQMGDRDEKKREHAEKSILPSKAVSREETEDDEEDFLSETVVLSDTQSGKSGSREGGERNRSDGEKKKGSGGQGRSLAEKFTKDREDDNGEEDDDLPGTVIVDSDDL